MYSNYLPPQLKKMLLSMAHHTDTAYKEDLYTETQMILPEPDRRKTLVSLFRVLKIKSDIFLRQPFF